MRRELVCLSPQGEQVMVAGPVMASEDARHWLDQAFVDFDCEPLRASGKVLTVDKIIAVARAAGPQELKDPAWTAAFAAATLAATGRESARLDLVEGVLK